MRKRKAFADLLFPLLTSTYGSVCRLRYHRKSNVERKPSPVFFVCPCSAIPDRSRGFHHATSTYRVCSPSSAQEQQAVCSAAPKGGPSAQGCRVLTDKRIIFFLALTNTKIDSYLPPRATVVGVCITFEPTRSGCLREQ